MLLKKIKKYKFLISIFYLFACIISINYMLKLKILKFKKYFNKEEVINNISLFNQNNLNNELLSFFRNNSDVIHGNLISITKKLDNKDWILSINLDTKNKKVLLLNKDLDWYSRQVSTRELYIYLEKEINECIDNNQSEYYTSINNIFFDFITEEKLQKMKNTINVDQKTLIINI